MWLSGSKGGGREGGGGGAQTRGEIRCIVLFRMLHIPQGRPWQIHYLFIIESTTNHNMVQILLELVEDVKKPTIIYLTFTKLYSNKIFSKYVLSLCKF